MDEGIVTCDGEELRLTGVSHVLMGEIGGLVERRFRAEGRPIDPPTYTARTAGGGTEEHQHDETTLEFPIELALEETDGDVEEARRLCRERTLSAKKAWAEHRRAVAEMDGETNERTTLFMLSEGVVWDGEVPADWVERMRGWGFEVPEDPLELRTYYLVRGLLRTVDDQANAIAGILARTAPGIDQAKIAGALDFFRAEVAGPDEAPGPAARPGPGALDEQPAVQGG